MFIKKNFVNYLEDAKKCNINNYYNNYYEQLYNNYINNNELYDLIFYGPDGCGKYSETLKYLHHFSDYQLKYEKKMYINNNKNEHIIKISDIHYEINVEHLTCNPKNLFNNIYNSIIDNIELNKNKFGYILCKNFHNINEELLDVFYSYMQKIINSNVRVKFILITSHLSFIPYNIINKCKILYFTKLSKSNIFKLCNVKNKKFMNNLSSEECKKIIYDTNNLNIYKNIIFSSNYKNTIILHKNVCDNILNHLFENIINFYNLRNDLYNILIYNLNINDCIIYILKNIIIKLESNSAYNKVNEFFSKIYIKSCEFYKGFNNNYRPIFHLENYFIFLYDEINNIKNTDC
jgi:DNA polymerase III delta prime subunit